MRRAHPALPADEERAPEGGRGSYPPDIARRRRMLGLPVTPEEHVRYARGELPEPPVTRAQIAATLRAVAPRMHRGSPFQAALPFRVSKLETRRREPGEEG